MQIAGCIHFGLFTSAIIRCRGSGGRVAHKFLHGDQIGTGVEQVPGKCPSQIVGSEQLDPSLSKALVRINPIYLQIIS